MEQAIQAAIPLTVFVIALASTINTQMKNIKEKKWEQFIKFITVIIIGVLAILFLKNVSFINIEYINNLDTINAVCFGLIVGLTATGTFDTIMDITKKNTKEKTVVIDNEYN